MGRPVERLVWLDAASRRQECHSRDSGTCLRRSLFCFAQRNTRRILFWAACLAGPLLDRIQEGPGLEFKIGPAANNALRVIAAGETISAPAVHLAYVKGDFDAVVQAMHE